MTVIHTVRQLAAPFLAGAGAFALTGNLDAAGLAAQGVQLLQSVRPGSSPHVYKRHVLVMESLDGTITTTDARHISAKAGYPNHVEPAAMRCLVRNAGAAEIDGRRVALRADTVTPMALGTAVRHLMLSPEGEVQTDIYLDGWISEIHPSPFAAVQRMYEAVALAMSGQRMRERASLRVAAVEDADGRAKALFDVWRRSDKVLGESLLSQIRQTEAWSNLIIVAQGRDGTPRFGMIGEGNWAYGPEWRRQAIGQPTSATPDPEYGAWVSRTHADGLESDTPRLLLCNAIDVKAGGDDRRYAYRAIDLPVQTPGGGRALLRLTEQDRRVPLLH